MCNADSKIICDYWDTVSSITVCDTGIQALNNKILNHWCSGDGATAGAGAGAPPWSEFKSPNFLMSSFAIISLALSVGWYSSQKTYLLLSLHRLDAGTHVRAGLIFQKEQHGAFEFWNPTKQK